MAIPAEPFARVIGRVIAQIDAEAGKKGMVIPFADLLIGGTALYSGYGLVTRNEPHFRMIPKLNVLPFKERPVQSICAAAGVPVHVTKVQPIDVRKIRTRMELSQSEFARKFGFSIDAVQNWEQGRRVPERSARILDRPPCPPRVRAQN